MVCIRNLTGLLLALAAAPSVLSKPVVAGGNDIAARQNSLLDLPTLGGSDTSSASRGSGGSASNSPSASPTNSPSNSPSVTASPTTATPTNSPTSISSQSTPSQTQQSPSQTSSPAQVTSIPASTSLVVALTTLPASAGQSTFIVVQTTTTGIDGSIGTGIATQAVAAQTSTPQSDSGSSSSGGKDDGHTPSTGTIVGAAVGGVAGLVLIIALVAVSWRIWGKNRHRAEEDDALMDDGVYGTSEVKATSGTSGGPSPFQNNLEQYHNGRTNPSANF